MTRRAVVVTGGIPRILLELRRRKAYKNKTFGPVAQRLEQGTHKIDLETPKISCFWP